MAIKQKWIYLLLCWLLVAAVVGACGEDTATPTRPTSTRITLPIMGTPGAGGFTSPGALPSIGLPTINLSPVAEATASPTVVAANTPIVAPTNTTAPVTTVNDTPTVAPTPTLVPFQPSQRQVAPPNCCLAFNFAADGRLYFYDKPAGSATPATYTLDPASGQRQLLSQRFGLFSNDLSLVAVSNRNSGLTTIEQVSDGARLATLSNRASQTLFSPDKSQVAYLLRSLNQAGREQPQFFELWVGHSDGSKLRVPWTLREGANLAWFPDNRRLLLTARDITNQRFGLWVIDTQAAPGLEASLIVESKGLIAASVSSDGQQVVYAVTFQGEANSGVWLAQADGSNRRKLEWTGGWRWSPNDGKTLFYIPIRAPGETSSALWSYQTDSAQAVRLTDPAALPLQIAGDEWQIAPDGKQLIYRRASDNALWLMQFRG